MSYDIELLDPLTREVIELDEPVDLRGGTYASGGTTEAWLNVTWNYGDHFRRTLGDKGIRTIYGMTGAESEPILTAAIDQLKEGAAEDYWAATEGNARQALEQLRHLARLAPHGEWFGD